MIAKCVCVSDLSLLFTGGVNLIFLLVLWRIIGRSFVDFKIFILLGFVKKERLKSLVSVFRQVSFLV